MGVVKAIPILNFWFQQLIQVYLQKEIEDHNEKFTKAIRELILNQNQIPLEEAIGSQTAGLPTSNREGVLERPEREKSE